ncbi:bifunctional nuclease domain-containing protein [Corynebacterium liangguodongii]|uniref:Bifunctional nuclease family protein n=1 Tax=Corynebacterium liangguodongii TaxID=2079535 RepID=A0A2S0WE04_9CORY|nr:bifunctional nuclease domain-containing protein [Corynebacterium liangguodongii]AWB83980.1 bifunctional nuclease family protein [Corynebacterium liangguodongii]PWB99991.1 bifunctional nuclease family protein [Corynebacterium liangguodongii]
MLEAEFSGIHPFGPERFLCVLLYVEQRRRFLPVWVSPIDGTRLAGRFEGWHPRRPHAVDALADIVRREGAEKVSILSVHEGVYIASVQLGSGESIDLRPSDAFALAVEERLDIEVSEDVVAAAGVWCSSADALTYLDLDIPELDGAGAEAEAPSDDDGSFAELMRHLGVEEEDLSGADDAGGTDVTDGEE